MKASSYVVKNVGIPGEKLQETMAEWKALSAEDQATLKEWALAEDPTLELV